MALDEFPQRFGNLPAFCDPKLQRLGNLIGGVARPAFGWIECHHAQRLVVLAGQQVADERGEVGVRLVRLAPRRALTSIIIVGKAVDVSTVGILLTEQGPTSRKWMGSARIKIKP